MPTKRCAVWNVVDFCLNETVFMNQLKEPHRAMSAQTSNIFNAKQTFEVIQKVCYADGTVLRCNKVNGRFLGHHWYQPSLAFAARSGRSGAMNRFPDTFRNVFSAICLAIWLPVSASAEPIMDVIRSLEFDLEARVGFYMHDMHNGNVIAYAENDRFPMNSTFKLLACGALLNRVENGKTNLTETVPLRGVEIVDYSPAIQDHIRAGHLEVSFADTCRMMLSVSDNTAANIVLTELGGPEGLTSFLRSIGDQVTRLDRWETALNEAVPSDPQDTTTPRAIAHSVQHMILGDALSPASRATLREWLADHRVADALFRSALPLNWSIDDRTGAGGFGSRSIVAVFYPPDRNPIITSLFITETDADFDTRNAAIAIVGNAIVAYVANE